MEKKIPIISAGGGILFDNGRNISFNLRKRIRNILNIDIQIILLIPKEGITNLLEYELKCNDEELDAIYKKDDIIKNTIFHLL